MSADDTDPIFRPVAERVSAAVVNFQTPDLLETAVRSFHHAYPEVRLLIIDNGSEDESPAVIAQLEEELGASVKGLRLESNRYHGPAMDLAVQRLETPYVFLLDSDTETHQGGFLEEMIARCEPDDVYGVGKIVHANRRGFASQAGTSVLVSAFMLIKRDVYLSLPPFIHHGLPALRNFEAGAERGYRLEAYPVDEYVEHFGRGTAERFGYGLGIKSRLEYLLHRLGL